MGQKHPLPGWLLMVAGDNRTGCFHGRTLALASGKDRSWQGETLLELGLVQLLFNLED